ncbi:MAG: VWA-like domain-containing protein [Sulfurovum sp.]|nr:VWA-like domain-containing protein [Sulfurovum sp.]MCB4779523.1 VWA-like domain-containing protein [Sulfurovum sp.]
MTHKDKLAKAKAKLMLEHPYIGSIATVLNLDVNHETLTFSSDGVSLKYNNEYIEKAPLDEIEFALANGAMHAVFKHAQRQHDRVGRIWQAATDLLVNNILVKNNFILPPYVYYDERFDGMYAEEIYDVLKDELIYNQTLDTAEAPTPDDAKSKAEKQNKEQESQQKCEEEHHSNYTPPNEQTSLLGIDAEEMTALQKEAEEYFEQIFQKFKRQKALPKGIEILVPAYFVHKLHWRELLYRYIAEFAKSTYSFMPPNMKYLHHGICLPSLGSDLLRIVIAIDTSGSVDKSLLSIFLGEVEGIMQSHRNYEIDLITADIKVRSHKIFLPGEPLDYTISGGGGTDFRPTFDYIDKTIDYPTLLLYFTDGMGIFPKNRPNYDVIWSMPAFKEVPFGEVLLLEKNG